MSFLSVVHTSRRRTALAGLTVSVALLLGACSSAGQDGGSAPAAPSPKPGGSITWGVSTEPVCFNPQRTGQQNSYMIIRNVFESLIARSANGSYAPWLAQEWRVSPDGKQYTFVLRDNVTFSDGEKLDATAVKQNLDFIADKKNAVASAASLAQYDHTEVVNPTTLTVVLKNPDSSLLESISGIGLAIVAPSTLALEVGAEQACAPDQKLIGTGPFTFGEYLRGQSITLPKNPKYEWAPGSATHTGPAYLDQVTYRFLPTATVRTGALTSGQVDVVEGVQATDLATVKANPALQLLDGPSSGTAFSFYINVNNGAATDVRVRQALRDGFDVDAAVKSLYLGSVSRAWASIGPDSPFYDASLKGTWGNNVDGANKLLDEAGWTTRDSSGYRTRDGVRLRVEVDYPTPFVRDNRDQLVAAIQAQLKQNIGLDLDLQLITSGQYSAKLTDNTWGIYPTSQATADPTLMFQSMLGPKGNLYGRVGGVDPQITSWLAAASATTDTAARKQYFDDIQQRVVQQAYAVPIYEPTYQIAAKKTVYGLSFETRVDSPASAYDVWVS
jgi:peptide/nickel transport system substrate-binding protein